MKLLTRLIPLFVLATLAIAAPTTPESKCRINHNNQNPGLVKLNCLMKVSKEILTRASEGTSDVSQEDVDTFSRVWSTLGNQYFVLFSGIQRQDGDTYHRTGKECPSFAAKAKELSEHWTEHASILPKLFDNKLMTTAPDTSKSYVKFRDNKHVVALSTLNILSISYHQTPCPGSGPQPTLLKGFDPVVAFGQSCPKANDDFKPTVETTIDDIKEIRKTYAKDACGGIPA